MTLIFSIVNTLDMSLFGRIWVQATVRRIALSVDHYLKSVKMLLLLQTNGRWSNDSSLNRNFLEELLSTASVCNLDTLHQ